MAKFSTFLDEHREGQLDEELGQKVAEAVQAVREHGKAATISLTLKIGAITIPDEFTFGAVPFVGGLERIATTCRLRFRIREGKLAIGYRIEAPHDVEQAAFMSIVEQVAESLELPLVYGIPAAPRS